MAAPDDETRPERPRAPEPSAATDDDCPELPGSTAGLGAGAATVDPATTASADGRYLLEAELARGGMGRVSRGVDVELGRTVAIKQSLDRAPEVIARLLREAAITARLQHPSIVSLYDVARDDDGAPLLVMRLIEGRPLHALIDEATTLDARLALVPRVIPAVEAIAFAHKAGVIHRDLKPSNILVGELGDTVVIDWGLASFGADSALARAQAPGFLADATLAGSVFGTPGFMAPEQARGELADTRADVFALGATLFYTLTGRRPFSGDSATRLIAATGSTPAPAIAAIEPGVPRDLATIVDKALAHTPDGRYPSAESLAADLRAFLAGRLVSAHHYSRRQRLARFVRRQRTPIMIAAVALAVTAAIATVSVRGMLTARARERAAQALDRQRADALIAQQAEDVIADDPTRAVALMRLRHARGDSAERAAVIEALGRGLFKQPRVHERVVVGALWLGDGAAALSFGLSGDLVWHDLDGQRRTIDLGSSPARALVRLGDGDGLVVTDDAIVRVDPSGHERSRLAVAGAASVAADGTWVGWRVDGAIHLRDLAGDAHLSTPGTELIGISIAAGVAVIERDHVAIAITLADQRERVLGPAVATYLSSDGREVILHRSDHLVQIDLTGQQPDRTTPITADRPIGLALGDIAVLEPEGFTMLAHGARLGPLPEGMGQVGFLPHHLIAAAGAELTIFDGKLRRQLRLAGAATTFAESPDGRRVLCGTVDGRVAIVDLAPPLVHRALPDKVEHIVTLSDRRYVVSLDAGDLMLIAPDALTRFARTYFLFDRSVQVTPAGELLLLSARDHVLELGRAGDRTAIARDVRAASVRGDEVMTVDGDGAIATRSLDRPDAVRTLAQLGEPGAIAAAYAGTLFAGGAHGALWRQSAAGRVDTARLDATPEIASIRPDGSVVLAVGTQLLTWPVDGPPRPWLTLPAPALGLRAQGALLITTRDQRIWTERSGALSLLGVHDPRGGFATIGTRRAALYDGAEVVLLDATTGDRAVLPIHGRLPPGFALLADDRTLVAVVDGELYEWRDPTPPGAAALAAFTDGLVDARLDDVRGPLIWP